MTDSKYGFLPEEDGYGEEELQSEEIVSKLRQAEVLIAQGSKIPDLVRTLGMTQVTYYHWRREFGGLQTDQVKRMKDLELENQRLARRYPI